MGLTALPVPVLALVAAALVFGFLNGFHDSSSLVATMVASRALDGGQALTLAAVAGFVAPFLFGLAVARTVGQQVLVDSSVGIGVLLAALVASIIWQVVTWLLGVPASSSHCLFGGLMGAALVEGGREALALSGLGKVLLALALGPLLGLAAGFVGMRLVLFLARGAAPRINRVFKGGQVLTSLALALGHGTNDAQKTMGLITLGLVSTGTLDSFQVPLWVVALCAAALALGTASGGWRLIRTLGSRFFKVRPVHGFAAQAASAAVILGAAILGGPVSTSQVVSSAIMGVGAAERPSKVRWGTGGQVALSWLATIPITALLAALAALLLRRWS